MCSNNTALATQPPKHRKQALTKDEKKKMARAGKKSRLAERKTISEVQRERSSDGGGGGSGGGDGSGSDDDDDMNRDSDDADTDVHDIAASSAAGGGGGATDGFTNGSMSDDSDDIDSESTSNEARGSKRSSSSSSSSGGGGGDDDGSKGEKNIERHSIEALRERLQKKIFDFRSQRNLKAAGTGTPRHDKRNNSKRADSTRTSGNKQKGEAAEEKKAPAGPAAPGAEEVADGQDVGDIQFTMLQVPKEKKATKAPGPGSKVQRMKTLLQRAEEKEKRLQELKKSEGGAEKAKEEVWKDTLKQATGERVYEDPSKLKKALKRREAQKKKSAKKWGKIQREQDDAINAKQAKREENLRKRSSGYSAPVAEGKDAKGAAPPPKKAKHGGAGFEGKKETGFLND